LKSEASVANIAAPALATDHQIDGLGKRHGIDANVENRTVDQLAARRRWLQ